ncbi:MAG: hypothetical protein RR816_04330, partial [Clostridia bacterium]
QAFVPAQTDKWKASRQIQREPAFVQSAFERSSTIKKEPATRIRAKAWSTTTFKPIWKKIA